MRRWGILAWSRCLDSRCSVLVQHENIILLNVRHTSFSRFSEEVGNLPLLRPQVLIDVLDQLPHLRRVTVGVEIVIIIVINRVFGRSVRHGRIRRRNVALNPRTLTPLHTHGTVLCLLSDAPRTRFLDALRAQDVSALFAEAVAQPAEAQDRHWQVAAGARDLTVLAQFRDDSLAFVLVAAAVPGEGFLKSAVVAQEAHLQVRLEEAKLGALFDLADALADLAH